MMLGMSLATFTIVHVLISLIAILSGFVVVFGLIARNPVNGWTGLFLTTTVLTSVTGFFFPFTHLLPSHKVGIISLVALAITIAARYSFHLTGAWSSIYAAGATLALYLNFFVLIVQSFQKVPPLHVLAPMGTEPPFLIAQLIFLALFIALGTLAVIKFRHAPSAMAKAAGSMR